MQIESVLNKEQIYTGNFNFFYIFNMFYTLIL